MIQYYQAGMINFLRTILWIVLGYYIFKFLIRFFAPFFVKKAVDHLHKKAKKYDSQDEPNVKQGETVIDKKPNSKKKINNITDDEVGEYVDFEEID